MSLKRDPREERQKDKEKRKPIPGEGRRRPEKGGKVGPSISQREGEGAEGRPRRTNSKQICQDYERNKRECFVADLEFGPL